jgi:hypothetical protein
LTGFGCFVIVLLSPQHHLYPDVLAGKRIPWQAFSEDRIFIHDIPDKEEQYLRQKLAAEGNPRLNIQRIHMDDAIIRFVEMNQGIGLVAKWRGEFETLRQRVCIVRPSPIEQRKLFAAFLKSNPRKLPTKALITDICGLDKLAITISQGSQNPNILRQKA